MRISTERQEQGFHLVEIMIVIGLLGILLAVVVPNFVRTRVNVQKSTCIENLHQIDQATQQWALEQKKSANAKVTYDDISGYLKYAVVCPAGGQAFSDSYSKPLDHVGMRENELVGQMQDQMESTLAELMRYLSDRERD